MNKAYIAPIIIGIFIGFILAVGILNRYESMTISGLAGRLDKLTGEACIFVDTSTSKKAAIDTWGVPPCL